MSNGNNGNSGGFYGTDGEYYPSQASQPSDGRPYAERDSSLYPKRPDITYTTVAYPGTELPAQYEKQEKTSGYTGPTKYCKFCGEKIPEQAVICTHCGCQVGEVRGEVRAEQPAAVNAGANAYANADKYNYRGRAKNKWLAFFLCFFGGGLGLHKFYEGKIAAGFLYMFTGGLFGIGWFIDIIRHLLKTDPYYL